MNLRRLAKSWDRLGRADPLWAVLYDPEKKGGRWAEDDFFATGAEEIASLMRHLESHDIPFGRHRVLDFGCGVGRLSQPLAEYFDEVDGVDIAASMIERARSYNRAPDRCRYTVNGRDDLALFDDDSFDVVQSRLVLQHIDTKYVPKYLREFLRVLRPGGLLVFDLPSGRARGVRGLVGSLTPQLLLNGYRRLSYRAGGTMELHAMSPHQVVPILEAAGGRVIEVTPIAAAPGSLIRKMRYCVQKAG